MHADLCKTRRLPITFPPPVLTRKHSVHQVLGQVLECQEQAEQDRGPDDGELGRVLTE